MNNNVDTFPIGYDPDEMVKQIKANALRSGEALLPHEVVQEDGNEPALKKLMRKHSAKVGKTSERFCYMKAYLIKITRHGLDKYEKAKLEVENAVVGIEYIASYMRRDYARCRVRLFDKAFPLHVLMR